MTETETINLILGNNNCTCIAMECQGALNVAISKPDSQTDILCPVYGNTCYTPTRCGHFNDAPFFRICENPSQSLECIYNMCFGNITEELNGTRMDFFVLNKTICESAPVYSASVYIRSFEIKGNTFKWLIILMVSNEWIYLVLLQLQELLLISQST